MIGRLTGKLIEKHPPIVLIDVNGVGYEVQSSMSTFFRLPDVGQTVTLHTHFIVREDAQFLCGFIAEKERHLFRELIKVNGIGAKSALSILSSLDADTFVRCVVDGDVNMLCKTPGIGKKTAERLVLEMRDRLSQGDIKNSFLSSGGAGSMMDAPRTAQSDAIEALVALGYKAADVTKLIDKMAKDTPAISSETMIRAVLKRAV